MKDHFLILIRSPAISLPLLLPRPLPLPFLPFPLPLPLPLPLPVALLERRTSTDLDCYINESVIRGENPVIINSDYPLEAQF